MFQELAVEKAGKQDGPYCGEFRFSKIHPTLEEAKQEAERLCAKEGKEFLVLQVVSKCRLQACPVVWEE